VSFTPTHRLIVSPLALSDLDEIEVVIARRNPLNAQRFVRKIRDQIDSLAHLPERSGEAPEAKYFGEALRHVTVWPYRIVYRVKPDSVEIVTIRHGARRPLKPPVGGGGPSEYPPALE
jgi:plasmid stabilization system protein ParE